MNNQKIYIGEQGINYLEDLIKFHNPKNILLVTGKNSFDSSHYSKQFLLLLKNFSYLHLRNLSLSHDTNKFDLIIAVGGGSVLDASKIFKFHSYKKNRQLIPLIAIPTTTGTGSESTQFATYYENNQKHSLDDPILLPDQCILDPVFAVNTPRSNCISSGLDAFCQAIESYWNCDATEQSQFYAQESMIYLQKNFLESIINRNKSNTLGMLRAANNSGQAIQITRTTTAHALSYKLTTDFKIPHGLAVALNLASLVDFNKKITMENCMHPGGPQKALENISKIESFFLTSDLAEFIKDLFIKLEIKRHLSEYGVRREDLPQLATAGLSSNRNKNNPRKVDWEGALEILEASY